MDRPRIDDFLFSQIRIIQMIRNREISGGPKGMVLHRNSRLQTDRTVNSVIQYKMEHNTWETIHGLLYQTGFGYTYKQISIRRHSFLKDLLSLRDLTLTVNGISVPALNDRAEVEPWETGYFAIRNMGFLEGHLLLVVLPRHKYFIIDRDRQPYLSLAFRGFAR